MFLLKLSLWDQQPLTQMTLITELNRFCAESKGEWELKWQPGILCHPNILQLLTLQEWAMPPILGQVEMAPAEMTDLQTFCEVARPPPSCPENVMDRVKGKHLENTPEPSCGLFGPFEEQVGQRFHGDKLQLATVQEGETANLLWAWICSPRRTFPETFRNSS